MLHRFTRYILLLVFVSLLSVLLIGKFFGWLAANYSDDCLAGIIPYSSKAELSTAEF